MSGAVLDLPRVVYDCNTLLQALARPSGPAGECVKMAMKGEVRLFTSPFVFHELQNVAARPKVVKKLNLTSSRVEEFCEAIQIASTMLSGFPNVFTYERDPDDAHYVNLALAAQAAIVVSRDKDLLVLMDTTQAESHDFQLRFRAVRILDPVDFLAHIRAG